jgi:hypothetical protein
MELDHQIKEQLTSLASNHYNRFWMKSYILTCMVMENAAQNIQLGIIGGKGVTTILEYNIEISKQIDGLSEILRCTNDITPDMVPWMTSMLGHMVFLRNTIHGVDINDLVGLLRPLQLIKLGITESRLGMEEAITNVYKKSLTEKWEKGLSLLH